jgi:hypothetical protein
LRRGDDDWVSCNAARNKNCPSEILEKVLKRGNNDNVSYYASRNRNCPKAAIKKWRKTTAYIIKSIKKIRNYLGINNPSISSLIKAQKMISETLKNIEK